MALNRKSRCCVVIVLLLASFQSMADTAIDARHFEDPVMAERYRDLTASLRCPKCDAQAINSSDSPVAADMRERVAMMLREGRADKEILDFMANRFGEFVLYNPRLDGRTWVLWALPAALVAGGALVVTAFVRARRHRRVRPLSEEERTRLSSLIHRHREGSE